MTKSGASHRLLSLLIVFSLLLIWELSARFGWVSAIFFPAPSLVINTLFEMTASGVLMQALAASLFRLAAGILFGTAIGSVLGFAMGAYRPIRVVLDPFVAALHPIPKLAIFPLFLITLGLGESSRIAVIVSASLFPMLLSVMNGVLQINRFYFEIAASYGASKKMMLLRVILPGSLPSFFSGLRLALNTSLVLVIAVEMLSADDGLGALVWMAWQTMRINETFAVLIVIAVLGLIFNNVVYIMCRRLIPWQTADQR